jgi:hypothetical protein
MDDVALGSSVTFRVRAYDSSSSESVSCFGVVAHESGSQAVTSGTMATGVSDVGTFTLSSTVSVPNNVNTNMYAVSCSVPNGSVIYTVRVQ